MRCPPGIAMIAAAWLLASAAVQGDGAGCTSDLPADDTSTSAIALFQARSDTGSVRTTSQADVFREVRARIQRLLEEGELPSVAVAVAKHGEILWEEGFGWADRELRIAATPHTRYALASITKPITATAVMALLEDGRLNLDNPVEAYLGRLRLTGLAGDPSGATVRRVMSNTAGLPLHYRFYDPTRETPASMAEVVSRYGILVYPPGEVYFYSNLGWGIIGQVVANASGQTYADFLHSRIFLPLGMTRTSVGVNPVLEPFTAALYDYQQRRIPRYRTDHPAASEVYSSAHDLLRFAMFHLGTPLPDQRRIIGDTARLAMRTVDAPPDAVDPYGLGWFVDNRLGLPRVWHTGVMPGAFSVLHLFPTEDLAVVVLTNQMNGVVLELANEITAALLPSFGERLRVERAEQTDVPPPPGLPDPTAGLSGTWSGTVTTHEKVHPFTLTFQPDGDIHVRFGQQFTALLNGVTSFGGQLMGRFPATLPTSDAIEHRHTFLLLLRHVDGKLSGQLSAQTLNDGVPEFSLTAYVELTQREPEG